MNRRGFLKNIGGLLLFPYFLIKYKPTKPNGTWRDWIVTDVDDQTKREIFENSDSPITRFFNIKIELRHANLRV